MLDNPAILQHLANHLDPRQVMSLSSTSKTLKLQLQKERDLARDALDFMRARSLVYKVFPHFKTTYDGFKPNKYIVGAPTPNSKPVENNANGKKFERIKSLLHAAGAVSISKSYGEIRFRVGRWAVMVNDMTFYYQYRAPKPFLGYAVQISRYGHVTIMDHATGQPRNAPFRKMISKLITLIRREGFALKNPK